MAAALPVSRWNSWMPSRAGSAQVAWPSAVTWQVAPGGQAPSTIAASPACRPASSRAASRCPPGGGLVISSRAGWTGPALVPGWLACELVGAAGAGQPQERRFGLVERFFGGGGDGQPRDVPGNVPGGKQGGGVSGRDDDLRGPGWLAGQACGE